MLLGDVDLRVGRAKRQLPANNKNCDNEDESFIVPRSTIRAPFYNSAPDCLSRIYGSTMVAQK